MAEQGTRSVDPGHGGITRCPKNISESGKHERRNAAGIFAAFCLSRQSKFLMRTRNSASLFRGHAAGFRSCPGRKTDVFLDPVADRLRPFRLLISKLHTSHSSCSSPLLTATQKTHHSMSFLCCCVWMFFQPSRRTWFFLLEISANHLKLSQ